MEHIRQYDWCALQLENQSFVTEHELDNCVTEKILSNRFFNPLVSSDSEDDGTGPRLDWNLIFKKRNNENNFHRIFVPGLRSPPTYTRLSAMTSQQHQQGIRVLCSQNPRILEDEFMPRPTKLDYKAFEDMKEIYEKEQKEYIAWAKTLWINKHCARALRPSPIEESVYEGEFKVRANQMKGYPTVFEMVAQIPLDATGEFEMTMQEELIGVPLSQLPTVQCPERIRQRTTVRRAGAVPAPCDRHPVRLVLPGEKSLSVLPIIEVHRELAQYAATRGAQFLASEGALRCLVERRKWTLPVTVFSVLTNDTLRVSAAKRSNVIVLGSEFFNKQENVLTRSFRAYRHLLEHFLLPPSEVKKLYAGQEDCAPHTEPPWPGAQSERLSDDDDDYNLTIDFPEFEDTSSFTDQTKDPGDCSPAPEMMEVEEAPEKEAEEPKKQEVTERMEDNIHGIGVYRCTCKDSIFERPPPRSFRKWQFRNQTTNESYDLIVHSAHKFKNSSGEVLVEPIVEYQADVGASKQTEDRIASLSLSLALRDNASVVNVRLDALSGDVITADTCTREQFRLQHGDRSSLVAGAVHAALAQLQGLVPGHYVIHHEPGHGDNALLYAPRNTGREQQLRLQFDSAQPAAADEANTVKTPPELVPALLPWHKFRKILPCAFTHYPNQIVKGNKQAQRKKTPPRALKWPKKRGARKPKAN